MPFIIADSGSECGASGDLRNLDVSSSDLLDDVLPEGAEKKSGLATCSMPARLMWRGALTAG
jgi:hypothetical protein